MSSVVFDEVIAEVEEPEAPVTASPRQTSAPRSPERDPGHARRVDRDLTHLERRRARLRAT